jgi:radical SAM superfamily enzyme YgiQ (UPF0313 family)
MKVLLINPPRSPENAIYDHASPEVKPFVHRKLVGPPLGILTIAAAAKDHDVTVLDLKGECDLLNDAVDYLEIVRSYLVKTKPDIVGVTFIASELPYGLKIFAEVKIFNPLIVTVAGGLHVSLCPHHFDSPLVDIACRGQSATSFTAIMEVLVNGGTLDSIPGILVRRGNTFAPTSADYVQCNAAGSAFIMPNRDALKPWLSTYTIGNGEGPATYIFTSLGCPFKCTFCSIWPQFDGGYYQRDVESIINELKTLVDYPIVRFADANTIVNVQFIEKLFDRITEEGIKKSFVMDIRADTAAKNPDLIKKCAMGGLKVVISGFESFRDDELSKYHKDSPVHYIEEAIRVFHDNGIMIRGNYVVPPDYTEKDFDALIEFASRSKVAYAGYTILTPMPGTEYYYQQKDNIIDHDLTKYNFFNCVTKTTLLLEKYYSLVADLWRIRKGTEII